ncbi:hypothetical protein EXIGLDRAFT_317895 [Exidia glandulosa HHB12029]|uniref:Uncharacterized protein n=1 Tax=Exidia glandulosa HHB12029 TaxID=1314781 RepID=A0A165Q1K1_EXIGL|nr:hypothetical protein EXIGLDRAFT_317895 [Exidia glandulosa HHB12029]
MRHLVRAVQVARTVKMKTRYSSPARTRTAQVVRGRPAPSGRFGVVKPVPPARPAHVFVTRSLHRTGSLSGQRRRHRLHRRSQRPLKRCRHLRHELWSRPPRSSSRGTGSARLA